MGSKVRDKIPEPGYSILQKKREYLCDQLIVRHIVGTLYSFQILDDDDKDRIEKAEQRSTREGVGLMVDILRYSGPNAYEKFLEGLCENGYEHVADDLKATEVEILPDPYAWIDELSAKKKNRPLDEKNLLSLSSNFSGGWESVMLYLGNTEAHNYQDKSNNQFNVIMQIFSALNRWRQRQASEATVYELLKAMRSSTGSQIDWTKVKIFVMELN